MAEQRSDAERSRAELRLKDANVVTEAHLTFARSSAEWLCARHVPPLALGDAIAVTVLMLRPQFERKLLTRGAPLRIDELRRCENLAKLVVFMSCGDIAVKAGIFSALTLPVREQFKRITPWWDQWRGELAGITNEAHRLLQLSRNPREALLFQFWWTIGNRPELDGATLVSDLKAGLKLAGVRLPKGKKKSGHELAAKWRELLESEAQLVDFAFVGNDGKIHLGKTQIRDRARSQANAERQWRERRQNGDHADSSGVSSELMEMVGCREPDPAEDTASKVDAKEVHEALQAVLAVRMSRAKRGSAEWHLLLNYEALIAGVTTPSQIADDNGMARSHMCDTWRTLSEAVTSELPSR